MNNALLVFDRLLQLPVILMTCQLNGRFAIS